MRRFLLLLLCQTLTPRHCFSQSLSSIFILYVLHHKLWSATVQKHNMLSKSSHNDWSTETYHSICLLSFSWHKDILALFLSSSSTRATNHLKHFGRIAHYLNTNIWILCSLLISKCFAIAQKNRCLYLEFSPTSLLLTHLLKPEVPERCWMTTEHSLWVSCLQLRICNGDLSFSYLHDSQPNMQFTMLAWLLFFQALRCISSKQNQLICTFLTVGFVWAFPILFWQYEKKKVKSGLLCLC